jgi:hypothetical protein
VCFACYRRASKTSRVNLFCLLPLRPSTCGAVTAVASILRPPWSMGREVPPASPSPSGSIVGKYSWPPCRAGTVQWARPSAHDATHGPFTRVVPLMGQGHFRRVVLAHGTTHLIHQRRRGGWKGGRRGSRRGTEEGVAGEVSSHRSRGGELKANNGWRRRIG